MFLKGARTKNSAGSNCTMMFWMKFLACGDERAEDKVGGALGASQLFLLNNMRQNVLVDM